MQRPTTHATNVPLQLGVHGRMSCRTVRCETQNSQSPQQNSAVRCIRRGIWQVDRLERVSRQAERRVQVALRTLAAAEAAHAASETAVDAAMLHWDTERAAAIAADDAATDAAVRVDNAATEAEAAIAAAVVAAAALRR